VYSIKTIDYGYSLSALDELSYFILDRWKTRPFQPKVDMDMLQVV